MKKRIKKILLTALSLVIILAAGISLSGCGEDANFINITGSNTVTPLTAVWAEEYMKLYSDVNIAVSGPGSGVGIAALIGGTTDICQASRKIKESEIEQAQNKGVQPYEIRVAIDALSVIVHPDNPITELTIAQLSDIYAGKITNWKDLGGDDKAIVAIARDTNSGTHVFFKEQVVQMNGLDTEDKSLEYGSKVLLLPSTEEGVSEVARNTRAIFYPGLGYLNDDVRPLGIRKTAGDPAVLPSTETALDGTYPISRPLLFYTDGEPAGVIKQFIDYCLSDEGQQKVPGAGYIPLP